MQFDAEAAKKHGIFTEAGGKCVAAVFHAESRFAAAGHGAEHPKGITVLKGEQAEQFDQFLRKAAQAAYLFEIDTRRAGSNRLEPGQDGFFAVFP
jgi:hypothetical protein